MNRSYCRLLGLLLPLLAAAALAGCSSDDGATAERPRTWKVSILSGSEYGDMLTTRTLVSVNSTGMSTVWQTTDEVQVYKDGSPVGTISPQTATASATLTGTLTGTFAKNNTLTLYWPDNSPNYTSQAGTLASISAKDYMQAEVTVNSVDLSNGILGTTRASFSHRQSFTKFTFSIAVNKVVISATGMSTITVTAASGNVTDFYVALPLEGSKEYSFACTTSGGVEYRGTKTGNLTNGKYYTTTVDIAPGVGVTNTSEWGNNTTESGIDIDYVTITGIGVGANNSSNWGNTSTESDIDIY